MRLRAERLGAVRPDLWLLAATALPDIVAAIDEIRPALVVVDSIQTVADPTLGSPPGSVVQVRACAHRLVVEAKRRGVPVVLVGHVTKDGGLAGPRVARARGRHGAGVRRRPAPRAAAAARHEAPLRPHRRARPVRDGHRTGWSACPTRAALFLGRPPHGRAGLGRGADDRGQAPDRGRGAGAHRRRAVRRARPAHVAGHRRRAAGAAAGGAAATGRANRVGNADVYVSTVGGVRLVEPGLDLAVCLAVVSALTCRPLPADLAVFGEVGLGGELRQVGHTRAPAERGGAARVRPRDRPGQLPERRRRASDMLRVVDARRGIGRRRDWPMTTSRHGACAAAPSSLPSMPVRYSGANEQMRNALARVAPGTPLRDGIDRVVRAKAGALLVLTDEPEVLAICSGGFLVDAPYSPQRLSELAKMDGAIIISTDGGRIARANVHLVPDPTVPTSETGTRHRTAERVARSLDVPVISASEEMGVINVYAGGTKHQLQEIGRLLDRANQALQTLERYKMRLDDAIANLTARRGRRRRHGARRGPRRAARRDGAPHRRRDRDDDHRARRRRPSAPAPARRALRRDRRRARPRRGRLPAAGRRRAAHARGDVTPHRRRGARPPHRAATLHREGDSSDLDQELAPKGLRLLHRVHRLPHQTAAAITDHFGGLAKLQRVTIDDLMAVDGVDAATARAREGDPRARHREHDPRPVQLSRVNRRRSCGGGRVLRRGPRR